MHIPPMRSVQRWLLLCCILLVYLFNVEHWKPSAFFGIYQDDSIYFSTAKALAQDHGYVLISFPGTPPQTKYPIVYPWLLSWVWKLNPTFPDNLKLAIHLTELFGCWTLLAVFLFLRKLEGLSEWVAMFVTALLVFQPFFLRLSGLVMSDVPFMSLMWTALLLTNAAKDSRLSPLLMLLAGAVAGLSVGIRMVGGAVIAGILCAEILDRSLRNALAFAASSGAVALVVCWPTMFHHAANLTSASEPGWNQVLLNYTDYVRFQWGTGIPSAGVLLNLVKLNFVVLLTSPGTIVAGPLGVWGGHFMAALSAPIWLGIVRQSRERQWRMIAYILIFYGSILLIWPYTIPDRFLVPFIPLFFAGLWCELRRLAGLLLNYFRSASLLRQRIFAVSLSLVLTTMLAVIPWNYLLEDPKRLQDAATFRVRILAEKQQAYQWIREHTTPNDRIAAWEDVTIYLYTGRQALRPIAIPQAPNASERQRLQRDLEHICDAPRHARVRYWLTEIDDFKLEANQEQLTARMAEVSAVLPVVFNSAENYLQIHDAACVVDSRWPKCGSATPVLFPDEDVPRE